MIMQKYCEYFKPWHGFSSKTLQWAFRNKATIMCFHLMTMDKVSFFTYGFCNYNIRLGKIIVKRTIQVSEHSLNLHFCIFERSQRKHNNLDCHKVFGIFSINYNIYIYNINYNKQGTKQDYMIQKQELKTRTWDVQNKHGNEFLLC